MSGGSRTNNMCEAWNRGFHSLVGTSHHTIWKALEHIRLDHHNVKTAILLEARGQPPQKRVRKVTKQRQDRLFNLCQAYYNDDKTLIHTLKGIGHIIQMEVTLICDMCKYPINLFWNLDVCLLGLLTNRAFDHRAFDQPGFWPWGFWPWGFCPTGLFTWTHITWRVPFIALFGQLTIVSLTGLLSDFIKHSIRGIQTFRGKNYAPSPLISEIWHIKD